MCWAHLIKKRGQTFEPDHVPKASFESKNEHMQNSTHTQ